MKIPRPLLPSILLLILPLLAPAPASAGTIYWEIPDVNAMLANAQDWGGVQIRPNGDYVIHLALFDDVTRVFPAYESSLIDPAPSGFTTTAELQDALDAIVFQTVVFNINEMPYDEPYSVAVYSDALLDGTAYDFAVFSTYAGELDGDGVGCGNWIDLNTYAGDGGRYRSSVDGTLTTDLEYLAGSIYTKSSDDCTPIVVPEPASAGLALAGVALLFKRRRRRAS